MRDIIDTHTHVISQDATRYPLSPLGGHRSTWSEQRPVGHEALLGAMDQAGIARAVVVQASTVYGHDNSYVADAVRAHPDRFVGVYSVDVLAPDAVEKIRFWQDQGLFGFRLFTTGTTMPGQAGWLSDERSFPAWAHAERNGIPICLQMTMDGLPDLRMLLERFPEARVLLDHLARPVLSDGPPYRNAAPLAEMARFPGVHLKLTNRTLASAASGASTTPAFVRWAVDAFGAERIAWGSNFPAAEGELSSLLAEAEASLAELPPADREMIFSGTARRLYPALGATRNG